MNAKYDSGLTPVTRLIYTDLLLRCNYGSRATRVSDSEIAILHGISERSARRSIHALCIRGYISKARILNSRLIYIVKQP